MKPLICNAAFALLVALPGSASAAETASMIHEPRPSAAAPEPLVRGCVVNVVGVADERNNRETLGRLDVEQSVMAGDLAPWLADVLKSLETYGYRVERNDAPRAGAINVAVKLTRAYTFFWPTYLGSMVALEVAAANGQASPTVKLRQMAFQPSRNWGGAKNHVAAINRAADSVIRDMAVLLRPACAPPA